MFSGNSDCVQRGDPPPDTTQTQGWMDIFVLRHPQLGGGFSHPAQNQPTTPGEARGPTCRWRGGRCGCWLGSSRVAHRLVGAKGLRSTRHGEEFAHLFVAARGRDTHVGAVVLSRSTVHRVIAFVWKTFLFVRPSKKQEQRKGEDAQARFIFVFRPTGRPRNQQRRSYMFLTIYGDACSSIA